MIDFIQLIWLLFGTLIGQIIIFFVGYTILYFLPNSKDFPALQKFAISYGLGNGSLALSMFICIILGIHSRFSFIPLLVIMIILFFRFKVFKYLKRDFKKIFSLLKRSKLNIVEFICIFFLIIEIILILSYWFIYPVYRYDAQVLWDGKARHIYFDGNFDYFNKNIPQVQYPILVPLNLTFFYSIYLQYHYFSKILFVVYFITLLFFLYFSLRFFKLNRTYSLLIITLLALISDVFKNATYAMADLTLTFFYTISIIFLFYYFTTKEKSYLLYSSIFMGFMAWSKEEGLGLLFLNVTIFIIYNLFLVFKKKIDYKKAFINSAKFFAIGFLIYLPWLLVCLFNNFTSPYISNIWVIFDFQTTIEDLTIIFNYLFLIPPVVVGIIFWIILLFVFIFNIKSVFKENIFFLALLIFFHFLLYIFIYIVTPFDLIWHLATSFSRELLHLMPICAFLLGILISNNENYLINYKKQRKLAHKILSYSIVVIAVIFIIIDIFFFEFVSNTLEIIFSIIIQ